jgi:sporulation protein YlmC with PRC-barrel domain
MRSLTLPVLAAAALAVASAGALAQTAPAAGAGVPFITTQPAGQWSAQVFLGEPVVNEAGETIGDINDVLFDKSGRIATAVIGVGGFLGVGEKRVAVPFSALVVTPSGKDGKRVVTVPLSKERLQAAPDFQPTEKTIYMRAEERATELGKKAMDTASDLRDKAARKLEEMTGGDGGKK